LKQTAATFASYFATAKKLETRLLEARRYIWLYQLTSLQTGRPDWTNFRKLGDCLLWVSFFAEVAQIVGLLFPRLRFRVNFDQKNILGHILGHFFANSSGRTGRKAVAAPATCTERKPAKVYIVFSRHRHFSPGTDAMIFKIFSPKNLAKKSALST
jgi:hypothetical protein